MRKKKQFITAFAEIDEVLFKLSAGGGGKCSCVELTFVIGKCLNAIGISLSGGGGHGCRR